MSFKNIFGSLLLLASLNAASSLAIAEEFKLVIGKNANGFDFPQNWQGRTIIVTQPENEHIVYTVEDMFAAAGFQNDVFVGQTSGINNAYAVIANIGDSTRRLIVIDPEWAYRFHSYRVILAHEFGHHLCRHTLDRYGRDNRWAMELEADRAGGALLRKSYADGNGSIGGDIVGLDNIVATVGALGPGSDTHPPAGMRVDAFIDGWKNGSQCLASYSPINPWPKLEPTAIERINLRYGQDREWCFFGAALVEIGPCLPRYPRVRINVEGNQMRVTLLKANATSITGVFPPDYRSAKSGILLFQGSSDKETIKGTFWHHKPGCKPVPYEAEGKFVENNGIFLAGSVPNMNGCEVVGSYAKTLHFFKNITDIL
jgi:hypothetical protein